MLFDFFIDFKKHLSTICGDEDHIYYVAAVSIVLNIVLVWALATSRFFAALFEWLKNLICFVVFVIGLFMALNLLR